MFTAEDLAELDALVAYVAGEPAAEPPAAEDPPATEYAGRVLTFTEDGRAVCRYDYVLHGGGEPCRECLRVTALRLDWALGWYSREVVGRVRWSEDGRVTYRRRDDPAISLREET